MSLQLSDRERGAIEKDGERAYPHEGCGLLLGRWKGESKEVLEIRPVENARPDSRENRYLIRPSEIVEVEREARGRGLDIVGFYHSHPDAPACPSRYDLEHAAWPGYSYVIVSIENGRAAEMKSWTLRDDRSAFDPEAIIVREEQTTTEGRTVHGR